MRNLAWQRDELLLALDLYFRHPPSSISQTHPEVVALSQVLNALPIHAERPDEEHFRNPNGTYMKLCNFLALDPSYTTGGRVGLTRGGKLEREVWDEFSGDRGRLAALAHAIRERVTSKAAEADAAMGEPEEEDFAEGKVIYRMHRARERNPELVRRAKAEAQRKRGGLPCTVCGFDFAATYGPLGDGFIECHHTLPLSELATEAKTRLSDVTLVCSNCHRMVHRRRPWLQVRDLAAVLASSG